MNFLIIVGTAREGRKSIHVAETLKDSLEDKGHETDFFDLKEKKIPPVGNRTYKENEEPVPEDIQEFSQKVNETDCIVIVTPEYNHSIPGILKTTLDYLYPEYEDKPFASVSVSGGGFGGVRGLQHLHDIVLELGGFVGPNLPVSRVGTIYSANGDLQETDFGERIDKFIEKTESFVKKLN